MLNNQLQQKPAPRSSATGNWRKSAEEQKAREIIVTAFPAACGHTAEIDHEHRGHSQRRNEGPHHRPRRTQHPQQATGVDLIIDDTTPGVVIVGGFDGPPRGRPDGAE